MSYGGRPHRGGRRRNRDDYDSRPQVVESPEQKLKSAIWKLGEVDVVKELLPLVNLIHLESKVVQLSSIAEAFRIAVTEQPYKIPHYVSLLRLLYDPPEIEGAEPSQLARQLLDEFWKGFQGYLDQNLWRELRLCIHFFAHLAVAKIVSAHSIVKLLSSFIAVLDEFGVSHGRAKKAALCAAEGLLIAGPVVKDSPEVSEIINAIHAYNDMALSQKWLVQPFVLLHSDQILLEHADEILTSAVDALKAAQGSDFKDTFDSFPRPYAGHPELDPSQHPPFEIPDVLVPPEVIEVDGLETEEGEDAHVKKEEWPEYFVHLFDDDITPSPKTCLGYAVRSALLDITDIFEVNRKECARLLMECPKWTSPGTFKPRPGSPESEDPTPGPNWQLESSVIETILGSLFVLPESSRKSVYHISLITELCKLSPTTIGPAVGKSIRKLYSSLADGLDVEIARRFAEWFAVHMSNFGFQWVWKEWISDLSLDTQHPRRAFMRRAVEFEIRLAYHDRIAKTLPPQMQDANAFVISDQAPGPKFDYDDPEHVHHDAAQSILNLFRGRAKAEDVVAHLDTLKSTLETSGTINIDSTVRSIVVQSLLHVGSRSFSHLLNAIERYLPLLRNLTGGSLTSGPSSNAEAKVEILTIAASFWKLNRQMVTIVFDKLMQYQIVDPTDIVSWTFINGSDIADTTGSVGPLSLSAFEWDLMRAALDKANGRVMIARRKVAALRKEDDETRAKAKARVGESMEVDADANLDEPPATENPALATALKAFASLTREQKAAFSRTLEGFVASLAPLPSATNQNPSAQLVLDAAEWKNRSSWDKDRWNAWETWGWYRHFCRTYAPYLRNYTTTLSTISFSRYEDIKTPAVDILKKTWNVATGQDA
ncbi:hypothetical protein HGRIS_009157 [Hohenbuehelia grisea]|uniref:Uncharacterized protein n=1 Tax=Hohenbuehelia grisea TaxID=104357 RepID=A0ABR3J0D0_9AGAR